MKLSSLCNCTYTLTFSCIDLLLLEEIKPKRPCLKTHPLWCNYIFLYWFLFGFWVDQKMGSISCFSSYGLIFKEGKESRNGSSIFQYEDLNPVGIMHLGSARFEIKGLISSSAKCGRIKAMASPTISAPKRERDPKKRIVITGMGLVSVFGSNVDAFYNKLLHGVSGITLIDRFDASEYPIRFAGQVRDFSSKGYVDDKKGRCLDNAWKYCLVAGKQALDDAGLGKEVLESMDKARMGVVVGSGMGGMTSLSDGIEALLLGGYRKISPYLVPYSINNMGSALLAIDTGLMGPTYSISTACATSNHCFVAAANHIRKGDANVMVAGGAESPINPVAVAGIVTSRVASRRNDEPQKASRPWDKNRDGFVIGEGCGVLIMESLEHAMKRGARIVAEYLGGYVTCDAHHMTDPRPDGLGISSCIIKSLEAAGVAPEEVNYVNAHGPSIIVGDLAEVNGIKKAFKNTSEIKMNSTKSMIGHGLGAAGGLEAIVAIKAINTGWLHPTINQYELEPEVTIDTIPNVKKRYEVNVAISNSFGLGGHNGVVVFAPFRP